MTYLERVLLAAGHVRGFERMERGREQYVAPYERVLRDLAGGVPGKGLGHTNDQDYSDALTDLEAVTHPWEERVIKQSLDHAHEALWNGDYAGAKEHLDDAKETVRASHSSLGALRHVLTEAQAHMAARAQEDRVPREATHSGPGGIIRHNPKGSLALPVQVDLAEPFVRAAERNASRRARQAARKQRDRKLPKLI